jgi:hypothetical protein
MDSPLQKSRLGALNSIDTLGTNVCNRKVMGLARNGSISEQVKSIQILSTTGAKEEEDFLSEMMNHSSSEVKRHIAHGLSQMVSRDFASPVVRSVGSGRRDMKDYSGEYNLDNALDKLDRVLRSRDINARIDAARALALMNDSKAEQLLYKLARDSDPRVRLEVVGLTPSLSREFAVVIMRDALDDESTAVRSSAIQIGKKFWPEQDWPEL